MTTTTVTNAQSIGTSTNIGDDKFVTKTAIQTGTTAFVITPRVTNEANSNAGLVLRVWYTSSSYSLTASAALASAALRQTAHYVDLRLNSDNSGVAINDSCLEPVTGGYIYTWCSIPTLILAATLDVNLTELP